MAFAQKAQAAIEAVQQAPVHVSLPVMLGSFIVSLLQPFAIVITVMWGVLQIHGYVEKRWGRDFLWLNLILRKGK